MHTPPPPPPPPYRLPAEWEPIERIWCTAPAMETTWPGCLDRARDQFEMFTHVMRHSVEVEMLHTHGVPTNDAWVRDTGPIFVHDAAGRVVAHDFRFNAWGGKYEPWDDDDAVGARVAELAGVPVVRHDVILEGGGVESNGEGVLLTTEPVVLSPTRCPDMTRDDWEALFAETFGITRTIWLPGAIAADDTDGHIDNLARFVTANAVLACRTDPSHRDHAALDANWRALEAAGLDVLPLPLPDTLTYDYPAGVDGPDDPGGVRPLPASYANFVICNGEVLVPIFGQPQDDAALAAIDAAFPGRRVVGLRAEALVVGLGALHCLTMQQPRPRT